MDKYLIPNANFLRLVRDWKTYGSLTVGYDFDDTVYDVHGTGDKYDYVVDLLKQLKSIGCTLVCWTAAKDIRFVEQYLNEKGIPYDGINTKGIYLPWDSPKPFFSAYLDDRAGLESMYRDLSLLVWYIKRHPNSAKEPNNIDI